MRKPTQTRKLKPYGLTARELQIINLLCDALSDKEMATKLGISIWTVKRHLDNLYIKIGAGCRVEAALFSVKNGLVALGGRPVDREALLAELEATHRKIERYVERSRLLIQKL